MTINIVNLAKDLAIQKAKIIDSQIIPFISKWQLKLIKDEKFRLTHRLFGYKLDIEHNIDHDTYVFKRYGKILNKFIIKTVVKL